MSDTNTARSMSGPATTEARRATHLPFARPSITDADVDGVVEVLRSGWITTGPRGARFEEAFAEAVGAAGAVAFSSGTAGMHLLLHAMDIGPGDEVITPSMTWVSTVNLITMRGATPVFVDVDRDTLLVAPEEIERRCSARTRLIIPVHFAGAPVDLDPIRALAAARGIPVIEDSAHAAGTEYRGRPIGAEGTSVFSFHPIKNMTTAEGGMVCSDDAKLLDRLRGLRFHGLGLDAFDRASQGRKPQAEVLEPGFKYNLPDLCAVLGLSQLERLHAMNERRRALAMRYRERLAGLDAIRPLRDPPHDFRHAWHLFIVRLDVDVVGMSRDAFLEALGALNIGAGIHFRAVHLQRYYAEQGHRRGELPDTEWNSDRLLSIPLFPDMTDQDVDDVVDAMRRIIAGA